jgi:hypothetical protein
VFLIKCDGCFCKRFFWQNFNTINLLNIKIVKWNEAFSLGFCGFHCTHFEIRLIRSYHVLWIVIKFLILSLLKKFSIVHCVTSVLWSIAHLSARSKPCSADLFLFSIGMCIDIIRNKIFYLICKRFNNLFYLWYWVGHISLCFVTWST